MLPRFFFFVRVMGAWLLTLAIAFPLWAAFFHQFQAPPGVIFWLLAIGLLLSALIRVIDHLHRVRGMADELDAATLSNRQRRVVDLPMEADAAFALLEGAVRELPRITALQIVHDSLRIQGQVPRPGFGPQRRIAWYNLPALCAIKRDEVLITIMPGEGTCRASLRCEPDAGAWRDLYTVDKGVNYEHIESLTRAIARRVAERRRAEQAAAAHNATEKELTQARLNLLQAQVEPHFLYNTLANAQVLAAADPPRAEQMLGHLIQYLRRSLPREENAMSPLGEELERTRAYLEILKIRMGPRLDPRIEVPDALKGVPLPSMMLQTLVENAIKHGLEPKPGGGTLWIMARSVDDGIAVTVADDGLGLGGAHNGGTGIGLTNLRERLRLIYGHAASFSLTSNFPAGVAATLVLPRPQPALVPPSPSPAPVAPPPLPAEQASAGADAHG
ncbi:histidine kinase [Pseudoxanthomonas sp. X-1]|uniref:sensor histidine kinase n=1 Tax=Pseudoxanthomonas sp. X-1 TaxID=2571115 RepID=UPI000DB7A642|nr:histidine kinase [Pseudoxanthomonas sp. X-1]PZP61560.1 MAG: sensor histidine kinase [Pseudoxanthomonas spadix]TMN24122.1 sensor histidine kinase [Pseudoxanthomonas sp. X-1]UAY75086.1 histidine kinase [Pseudoxanthomonas sp. X-1]